MTQLSHLTPIRVTSTPEIPGHRVTDILCYSTVVLTASHPYPGNYHQAITGILNQAQSQALVQLAEAGAEAGAQAVVGVTLSHTINSVNNRIITTIIAAGTFVLLEPIV